MALPSLHSELVCLQNLQEILQKRLDLESVYNSSLAAWHTAAYQIGPQPTHALRGVFLSLVQATENDIQSRWDMEKTFRSQIEGLLAAMEGLRDHFKRIGARSKQLEEINELAKKAREQRRLRYEEWKDWKSKPVPPAGVRFRSKPRNLLAPTESIMADAYNLADMEIRRCVSAAEIARCSFKDKAIEEAEVISRAYRVAIDAITKCLWLFAKNQQQCASSASAGANMIVKVADDISSFRVANSFHEALESEAQDIPTVSIPYEDLETISRYPNIQSQPIILGFSLPPHYLSYTMSTRVVVNVFCQLVSFVHDQQAWEEYATRSTSRDYTLAPTVRDLERCWTREEDLNRNLLRDLGPSLCADLVKTLLVSFPDPLINCSEVPVGNLRLWNPDTERSPDTTRDGPSNQNDAISLVPLVPPLYCRPQGEMLRALCTSLIPVFKEKLQILQERISEIFSDLLTRKGECIKHAFPNLVREFSSIVTITDNRIAPPRPARRIFDPPHNMSLAALPTRFLPAPSIPAPRSPTTVYCASQSFVQVMSTTVQVVPKLTSDEISSNNTSAGPCKEVSEEDNTLILNDVECLRKGIIKTSNSKIQGPYTFLLVGETGVGKSSFLEFITNVLIGNSIDHYDLDILDHTNEQGRPNNQSQTNSARLYEITSNNGMVVRILDTPGLVDIRGIEQDELHKKSIATQIEKHVETINAVIVFVNGTTPSITEGTDYTLSTLSALFPKTLANNIAFMFTNVPDTASWRFSEDTIPEMLKEAPQFLLDNPIALQKRYLRLKNYLNKSQVEAEMRKAVQAGEQRALEMLVNFFDWLDDLEPQPTMDIINLYEMSQAIEAFNPNILAQDLAVAKKAEIDKLITMIKKNLADMDTFSDSDKTINVPIWKQQLTTTHKIDEQVLDEQDMKKKWKTAKDGKEKTAALLAVNVMVLRDLNQVINRATNDLLRLMEQYAGLSLSGCFLEQLRRTVGLLEQRHKGMEENGIGQFHLQTITKSLDDMKRKLELLNNAREDNQKESVGIGLSIKELFG